MTPSTLRPAAVAGLFYPAAPAVLRKTVQELLQGAAPPAQDRPVKALIVPHAGYVYSGPIAATAYRRLHAQAASIRRVVLLGPAHRAPVRGLALPNWTGLQTPLGIVPVDQEGVAALQGLPQVVRSDPAHAAEHSLEVQLPFLQVCLGSFAVVPLAVGEARAEQVAEVLERLWGGPETLLLISSDLSHYLDYDTARQLDAQTAHQILACRIPLSHDQACGATPVNGLLLAARRHGLVVELLDLRNSGDTAGDRARVVGYGAFALHPPQGPNSPV
ncbi:MAG: AmmeMemoRadiSam system protein B [Myxococcales bacterium]|nr:AmmeMemoRadiSam system protein B [Myxococcota bacterium]MDW8282274.1 AmmeMemoRadiSam system protein B [Myxococcales bacterium]